VQAPDAAQELTTVAMIIYLACTVRGDRSATTLVRALADALESAGHTVLTRHLLVDDAERAEAALTERAVFERDLRWLDSADVLIAEASGSSYGVGFEVGYVTGRADRTGQRVLVLYDASRRAAVSRLVAGNTHPECTTYPYRDAEDVLRFVEVFLTPRPAC
jgi:nucleoside 2-deoxyribosyltransferase